ncbi:MAG: response regulator [Vicinamibacteria bacterium]|nr:response regulator [Vicinamibacteria bacterium]
MQKKKILIIDDDVQHVDALKSLLESVGFEAEFAYRPEKGIALARAAKPDLILLDVMFAGPPGPDGVEISRQLKADAGLSDIPIIILSGVRKVLDLPIKLGPDEEWMPVKSFLEKPIKPDKLLAEIKKVLG